MNFTHTAATGTLALLALLGSGCGSSDSPSPAFNQNGATGGDTSAGGGNNATGGAGGGTSPAGGNGGANASSGGASSSAGAGGSSGAGGATSGGGAGGTPATTGGTTGAGGATACATPDAWDVTYNLDGSTFEVRDTPLGAGDQVNTATAPYSANNEIGPGTMVIRFKDTGGSPAAGPAHLMSYTMNLEFTVAAGANVHTELTQDGMAATCGAATGAYDGTKITWADPGMSMRTHGNVTCTGTLCSLGGLPDGPAQPQDTTKPQALKDFTFTGGASAFAMVAVQNSKDTKSSTWMSFKATETGRKAVCDCK